MKPRRQRPPRTVHHVEPRYVRDSVCLVCGRQPGDRHTEACTASSDALLTRSVTNQQRTAHGRWGAGV